MSEEIKSDGNADVRKEDAEALNQKVSGGSPEGKAPSDAHQGKNADVASENLDKETGVSDIDEGNEYAETAFAGKAIPTSRFKKSLKEFKPEEKGIQEAEMYTISFPRGGRI